jgi:hypothetical protein
MLAKAKKERTPDDVERARLADCLLGKTRTAQLALCGAGRLGMTLDELEVILMEILSEIEAGLERLSGDVPISRREDLDGPIPY